MGDPLTIKLHCASWGQLDRIYKRDLTRSAVFLKTKSPPPLGTPVRINLTLPSETLIILQGEISEHVPPGGLDGRGPGVDVRLAVIPQSAMWLIESALSSARARDTSKVQRAPAGATASATRQRRAPPADAPRPSGEESALEEGAPVVAAEAELVAALRAEHEALRKRNPFQVLGVGYDADDQKVRDAFARLTKKYHPDRYARYQSVEARELASEVFILIRDAYRRTGSPRARELTLRRLQRKRPASQTPAPARAPTPRPAPSDEPEPLPPPPTRRLSTDDLFEQQPAAAPPPPLEVATQRPRSELDRADQLIDAGRVDEALAIFTLASKRNPGDLRARAGVELCEGLRALVQRDRLEAAQRFEMALELDPENERAARELSEMRRQATQDRKGLLARLLGKKE